MSKNNNFPRRGYLMKKTKSQIKAIMDERNNLNQILKGLKRIKRLHGQPMLHTCRSNNNTKAQLNSSNISEKADTQVPIVESSDGAKLIQLPHKNCQNHNYESNNVAKKRGIERKGIDSTHKERVLQSNTLDQLDQSIDNNSITQIIVTVDSVKNKASDTVNNKNRNSRQIHKIQTIPPLRPNKPPALITNVDCKLPLQKYHCSEPEKRQLIPHPTMNNQNTLNTTPQNQYHVDATSSNNMVTSSTGFGIETQNRPPKIVSATTQNPNIQNIPATHSLSNQSVSNNSSINAEMFNHLRIGQHNSGIRSSQYPKKDQTPLLQQTLSQSNIGQNVHANQVPINPIPELQPKSGSSTCQFASSKYEGPVGVPKQLLHPPNYGIPISMHPPIGNQNQRDVTTSLFFPPNSYEEREVLTTVPGVQQLQTNQPRMVPIYSLRRENQFNSNLAPPPKRMKYAKPEKTFVYQYDSQPTPSEHHFSPDVSYSNPERQFTDMHSPNYSHQEYTHPALRQLMPLIGRTQAHAAPSESFPFRSFECNSSTADMAIKKFDEMLKRIDELVVVTQRTRDILLRNPEQIFVFLAKTPTGGTILHPIRLQCEQDRINHSVESYPRF